MTRETDAQDHRPLPRPLRLPRDRARARPRPGAGHLGGARPEPPHLADPASATTARTPTRGSRSGSSARASSYWRTHVAERTHDTQMSRGTIHQYRLLGLMPIGDTPRTNQTSTRWWYHTDLATKKHWFGEPFGGPDTEIARPFYVANLEKRLQTMAQVANDPKAQRGRRVRPRAHPRAAGADHRRAGEQRRGALPGQRAEPGRDRRPARRRGRRVPGRRERLGDPADPGRPPAGQNRSLHPDAAHSRDGAPRSRPSGRATGRCCSASCSGITGRARSSRPRRRSRR